ncbi:MULTISPECIES: DUF3085 domain-containing protein [Enterobacterales]|uniref:DUF3085 domain-containing protein n=1 Tax=Enterobacterales TaxID=91347 RepID=UPI000DD37562|nr:MULTISPECIES: DUF3085 domain-containing protein [Enterobacterales]MBU9852017.1 DUF3085 domain-containing protein [Rahnella aceris]MBU9861198.1 DUF3085 domain-containing protein [Rahnella aceris]MBZ7421856.1 DUF3085 domain-containing protein [Klebsiella michiganensis]CAH0144120.1 hypothetical protein SRABI106_00291 [Rahnella aquatilis]
MSNKLWFKAEKLAPVMADVKKNGCKLWFIADEGIYLTAEKATFVHDRRNISYAEGFDPDDWDDAGEMFDAVDNASGGSGDVWESIKLEPEMLDVLITGAADLTIEVTNNAFVFSASLRDTGKTV